METYIAILRGINVSGQKKIKMEELRNVLAGLDFRNLQTYIQSGNIIFKCERSSPTEIAGKIHHKILSHYGFEVPVLVLSSKDLKGVHENNPFVNDRKEDISKLHVTFLAGEPKPEAWNNISGIKSSADEMILSGKAIYLFCPNGYGRTKLNNNFFENKLKVTATTRNWKTVSRLVEMAFD